MQNLTSTETKQSAHAKSYEVNIPHNIFITPGKKYKKTYEI